MALKPGQVYGDCGHKTSGAYARNHNGLCKRCYEGEHATRDTREAERKQGRLIDHGHDACQREDGAYDLPDWA